jgi:hypothetical protein
MELLPRTHCRVSILEAAVAGDFESDCEDWESWEALIISYSSIAPASVVMAGRHFSKAVSRCSGGSSPLESTSASAFSSTEPRLIAKSERKSSSPISYPMKDESSSSSSLSLIFSTRGFLGGGSSDFLLVFLDPVAKDELDGAGFVLFTKRSMCAAVRRRDERVVRKLYGEMSVPSWSTD